MKFVKVIKSAENNTRNIKIFLTNLGKYNEGELVGEWVTLPVNDFKPILDKIGINNKYEEWFITDYSAPFNIGEYDNINELNEVAKQTKDFNDIDWLAFSEFIDNGYSLQEAVQKTQDHDYTYIDGITEQEFGLNFVEDVIGGVEQLDNETLTQHFDYESFGRSEIINGSYIKVKDGNNFGWISINN